MKHPLPEWAKVLLAGLAVLIIGVAVMSYHGAYNYDGDNQVIAGPEPSPSITAPTPLPMNDSTPQQEYTLYVFEQPNCEYCTELHPQVQAYAAEHPNVRVSYVNIQQDPALANKFAVRGTPTTIVTNANGTVYHKWVGLFNINELNIYVVLPPLL